MLAIAIAAALSSATADGFFARQALAIWTGGDTPTASLRSTSPDGASRAIATYNEVNDGEVFLTLTGRIGSGRITLGPGINSELLWAPDSKAIVVTTSDGGANGPYRTLVVTSSSGGLLVRDVSLLITVAFGHPVKCGWPENPNVGAIQWMKGSKRLVVAAEIVAHSNCDSFGTFRAYEIDWRAMRILKSFDQIEAKQRFGNSLGIELRGAPDECARTPRKCWVSTNHEDDRRSRVSRPKAEFGH